ncbi:MAG: M14 family zinc carboxypeptidase [Thermoplasmatota archaeon]
MKKYKKLLVVLLGLCLMITFPVAAYSSTIDNNQSSRMNADSGNDFSLLDNEDMGTDWYYKPANYAELVSWYHDLEALYPDYIDIMKANEVYQTGTVTGGYDLYYVRITNESLDYDKPKVLFLGSPHGDETVGTIGLYWFADWLMRMAFTDEINPEYSKDWLKWIIDNREIFFEISHNPYGLDQNIRYDANGWDLNREADYDGPGSPTGGIWGSVPGQTMRAFVDSNLIRVGCDFHGGARMLLYPWADTHSGVTGTSPITGTSYGHAPPDFYFYDVSSLRLGSYMGTYGGLLNQNNIGTIHEIIWYSVKGGIANWGYGADVEKNPAEDPYVQNDIFGNYPGSGILWVTPEMSTIKNPAQSTFGNDTIHRYGAEVRRYVLHQTDIAQPYVRWQPGTVEDDSVVLTDTEIPFRWQVNGSLVVDNTYMQWSTNPDPINHPQFFTDNNDEFAGEYIGGTGWDNPNSGQTNGVTYEENIIIDTPGDYYFVAKAKVDQIYADVLRPDVYGGNSYLRLIKERTNDSYYEMIEGLDGIQEIFGQIWWYSPIIHVRVNTPNNPPEKPETPKGPSQGSPGTNYLFSTKTIDVDGDKIFYNFSWGDGTYSGWIGPFDSGEEAFATHSWDEKGTYEIKVKAKDIIGDESDWSDPLSVSMPKNQLSNNLFIQFMQQFFPRVYQLLFLLFSNF